MATRLAYLNMNGHGNKKSNDQFPKIDFDNSGSYLIKLKIIFSNDSSQEFEQVLVVPDCNKRIQKQKSDAAINENNLNVFPNPTKNSLTILLKEKQDYQIVITDALGRIVLENKFAGTLLEINCELLTEGLYYIKVFNELNSYNSKFVKQ